MTGDDHHTFATSIRIDFTTTAEQCEPDLPATCHPSWLRWELPGRQVIANWTWDPWMDGVITQFKLEAGRPTHSGVMVKVTADPLEVKLQQALVTLTVPGHQVCEANCLL